MKATIGLEYIGKANDDKLALYRERLNQAADGLGSRLVGAPSRRPWVAQIIGRDPKYGYARKFVAGKTDYAHANGAGTRGVYLWFVIDPGVYEVSVSTSWKSRDRYFLTVEEDGSQRRISGDEVESWLSAQSV